MDIIPGSNAHDSRSLSVEAARFDSEATDAQAQIRQLEAQLTAIREKAEHVRLQKQQIEAAREDAFQKEREDRQAAVRESITDHHLEGMVKSMNFRNNFVFLLKGLAAGDLQDSSAQSFLRDVILRELIGGDDREFLSFLANKLLKKREVAVIPQSPADSLVPKYQDSLKQAPASPTRAVSPLRSQKSLQPECRESLDPGTNKNATTTTEFGEKEYQEINAAEAEVDLISTEVGSVQEMNHAGEDCLEQSEATSSKFMEKVSFVDADEQEPVAEGAEIAAATTTNTRSIINLEVEEDAVRAQQNENSGGVWTNAEFTTDEQRRYVMADVNYSNTEEKEAILKQDSPGSITDIANLANRKLQSADTVASIDSESTPLASFSHPSTAVILEEEHIFSASQTPRPISPQPVTPILNKITGGTSKIQKVTPVSKAPFSKEPAKLTSANKTPATKTPASKKPTAKRKLQESGATGEATEATELPVTKKGKTDSSNLALLK